MSNVLGEIIGLLVKREKLYLRSLERYGYGFVP